MRPGIPYACALSGKREGSTHVHQACCRNRSWVPMVVNGRCYRPVGRFVGEPTSGDAVNLVPTAHALTPPRDDGGWPLATILLSSPGATSRPPCLLLILSLDSRHRSAPVRPTTAITHRSVRNQRARRASGHHIYHRHPHLLTAPLLERLGQIACSSAARRTRGKAGGTRSAALLAMNDDYRAHNLDSCERAGAMVRDAHTPSRHIFAMLVLDVYRLKSPAKY